MPIIAFVSPKGGAGKTTSALVLADQIARAADVTVIDADPNKPIFKWSQGGAKPERMSVVSEVDENDIIDKIEEAASRTPFVIVDLEGTAAKIVVLAISQADLVIVPTQGSQLDAEEAKKAFQVIRQQEKMVQRQVPGYRLPYSVLLTRTNSAIRTRTLTHIERGIVGAGIPVFKTEMNEREAFRAMFSFRQTLDGLSDTDVANLGKARANAENFAREVISTLRTNAGVQQ